MAATGYTPIYLYYSSTTSNTPSAGNLGYGELALNITDKNLFFKDNTNAINTVPIRQASTSSNGWLSSTDWTTFNNKSPAAGSSSITTVGTITSGTWNGSTIDIAHGGTNATSFNAPVSSINGLVWFDGTRLVNDATSSDVGYNASTGTFYANNASVGGSLTVTSGSFILGSGGVNGYISGNTWYGINTGDWVFQAGNPNQNFRWNSSSGSARMVLDLNSNLLVGTTSSPSGSGNLQVPSIYSNTTASIAYVAVSSAGLLQRGGVSALKYKQDIRDLESIDINLFRPVRYKSKCEGDDQTIDYFGIIADEVDAVGIKELVTYGEYGEIEGFQYERFTVVLLKEIQELKDKITSLKSTLINAIDDSSAALAGVEIGQMYRNGSIVMVRIS